MTVSQPTVACFGETIWDSMPHGLFIGGAPYNVAYHLSRLGVQSLLVSAVGSDELGKLAIEKAQESGIDISCFQISDTLKTGISDIKIDERGNATYRIRKPAAWDDIQISRLLIDKVAHCQAIVYGTLAARATVTRATLEELLNGFKGLKICDLNLRKSGDDQQTAIQLAQRSDVLKLNEDELFIMAGQEAGDASLESAMGRVHERTKASMLFVTRAAKPAAFYDGERTLFASPPNLGPVVDTVGAGDAFTAAIVRGLLRSSSVEECLDDGVRLGSFIATKQGAQPRYDPSEALSGTPAAEG